MESAGNIFRSSLDKAASGIPMSPQIMTDINKIKSDMKETENQEKLKKSAKKQFSKDLQNDPDYIEFKKNSKFYDRNVERTFGVPNVTSDDPYINKRKYGRVGKEESKEATGSGSSGAYSSPLFGGDDQFIENSNSETPKKVEAKEATGSGSVGAYETPASWAKSTQKKDWRGKSKTQIPGGAFVSVKKKCTKFPYCNKGDISALHIYKNESVAEAIKNVAEKTNLSENVIKAIIEYEYEKKIKSNK